MTSPIELQYSAATTMTLTGASLANAAARQSTAVDNTSTLYQDAQVQFQFTTGASGVSTTGVVNIFAVASDDGTNYGEQAGVTDAAITLTVPPNARLIGTVNAVATSKAYISNPFSVAQAFGGLLPPHWVIIVQNLSGAAFAATATTLKFVGILFQS